MVTPVSGTNQCAEIDRMALGRTIVWPIRFHASVYSFFSKAFMGLPWPKKIAGSIMGVISMYALRRLGTRRSFHQERRRRDHRAEDREDHDRVQVAQHGRLALQRTVDHLLRHLRGA